MGGHSKDGLGCAGRLLLGLALAVASVNAAPVDYTRDVQPILEKRCFSCHGPEKQKSSLRLDRRADLLRGGDSGQPAVVPGDRQGSLLVGKVTSTDPTEVMPPKGERLSTAEIELLQAWVEQGASMPEPGTPAAKHWAYEPPRRPTLPATQHTNWPVNPLDTLVLARLEREGLAPEPEADRLTWLRRVSLDLVGLPPTLEEMDAFLLDNRTNAHEAVVDCLLASPHYGERWVRPWLDLARYADTQGYEKDNRRSMWPYRDWVIRALNANKRFDQFTVEQIAGDLLPNATVEQKVATGFHRNTMTNTEGGTDNEEFRYEAVVDRVNTTFSVWMGTTLGCAQCHDHKYDPFTSKEYYQVFAFLNNTADADADDEAPTMKVFAPGQESQLATLRTASKKAEAAFQEAAGRPEIATGFEPWQRQLVAGLTDWQPLDPVAYAALGGAAFVKTDSKSLRVEGPNNGADTYTVICRIGPGRVTGLRLEALETGEAKALGRHAQRYFVLRQFAASLEGKPVALANASADYAQTGYPVTNLLAGTGNGWAVDADKQRVRRSAYFALAEPLELAQPAHLTVTLRHSEAHPTANLARFRLYTTQSSQVGPPVNLPDDVRAILLVGAAKRDEKQRTRLHEYYLSVHPQLERQRVALATAQKGEKEFFDRIPITSVMEEMSADKRRQTHRHIRGAYLSKGEPVSPGVPAVLHPWRPEWPTNRLGLAYWLTDTNNPLMARVIMNRIWEQYFGRGLMETVEEFGKQGEPPTHPELLDWLATEFMDTGWDLKAMHKRIALSATYRQSASVSPELLARDPYNRWLARGPRVRLEAEMIRDQALAISGLLSRKVGGPSVMPPQPEGLWQIVYSGDKWETSPGEDKYRRGLYTFWRRSIPHPMMTSFDAPTREFCVLRRSRSNTPLQALNTLNDPAFVECAQALARRIAAVPQAETPQRLSYGFRLCLAREPRPAEIQRLVKLYETELAHYRQDTAAAEQLVGSAPGNSSGGADTAELAAWTVVANVLLNLDEFITKG